MIEFKDGQKICFTMPPAKLQGLVLGDRLTSRVEHFSFWDSEHGLKTVIHMGQKGEGLFDSDLVNLFSGAIYRYNPSKPALSNSKFQDASLEKILKQDCVELLHTIKGDYLTHMRLDEEEIWNIARDSPMEFYSSHQCLPSDCTHREDILWMKYG